MRSLVVSCTLFVAMILLSLAPVKAQDVQGDIYVEANIDNPHPYVGQQIIYSFKLYDAIGLTNPLYQPSDFEGFWRIDIGVVSQTSEQINGRQYNVTIISTALYPTRSGSITLQPSSVVLPETVFRAKQTLTANPVSLDVKTLPLNNSSGFNGAVGQFSMSATLDRQAAKIGEPVVMTLTITGTGNVEQLPPPTVPANWRATINAGNYKSEIQNGLIIGTRDYQIVFIPTASGTQDLPPISLDYFDPISESYKSMSTSAIQIQISGDNLSSANTPLDASEPSLRLKPIVDFAASDNTINPLIMIIAALIPLGAVGGVWYRRRLKAQKGQLQAKLRQQQALQMAMRSVKAISLTDPKVIYKLIDNSLKGYIADKLVVDLELVKQSDLSQFLSLKNVSENAAAKVQSLVSEIEEGLFSPASNDLSPQRRDEIMQRFRQIDEEWLTR